MANTSTNPIQWALIKGGSVVLITTALGLMGWKGYAIAAHVALPAKANVWVVMGLILIVLHGMESIVAARIAASKGKSVIQSAFYTFFTGMAGLADTYNASTSDSASD